MDRTASISANGTTGFTPVQRRLSTIDTRRTEGGSEKEWTAARCHRLLRALQSRVAILKKDLSRLQPGTQDRETVAGARAGTIRKADTDVDWNPSRKKVKRTYSTRGGANNDARCARRIREQQVSNEGKPFVPGEISVPTPILHRARGEILPVASSLVLDYEIDGQTFVPNKRRNAKDVPSDSKLSQTLRAFRKQIPTTRYAIYEGIYNGLEALLKATNLDSPPKDRTGSKSLLSLCLKTVPCYIAHEEGLFFAHTEETKSKSAINNRNISTEIYDDLEAYGCNGRGWKHFRTIVRSHGLQLVSDAIRAGSLDTEFVGILITQCIHTKATDEAEILLSALLSTTKFAAPKSVFSRFEDDSALRPLSMLWKFVEITGRFSFQYRQVSALMSTGILPLNWLATKELGSVWTRAIQVLSSGADNTDALQLMDTLLPLLAQSGSLSFCDDHSNKDDGLMLDAMKQTLLSLLTTLSSIVILSEEAAKQLLDQGVNMHRTGYEHIIALVRSCWLQSDLSNVRNIQSTLLLIANLLLGDVDHESPGSRLNLIKTLFCHLHDIGTSSSILPPYHEIVSFICSITRCCGRGASNSGFEYLQDLHEKLAGFIRDLDLEGDDIVGEILADSALAFAQDIPDRKYLDYADMMETKVHRMNTKPRVSMTPGQSLDDSRVGFRWEEGISEWVMATPYMSTTQCHGLMKFPQRGQLECQTPFRSNRRTLRQPVFPNFKTCGLQSAMSTPTTNSASEPSQSPILDTPLLLAPYGCGDDGAENQPFEHEESEGDLPKSHLYANSPVIFNSSGDERMSEAGQQFLSEGEDSSDELQPSSPSSVSSLASKNASSPCSKHSLIDESFTSVSSTASAHGTASGNGRRRIDRVPRLSRRVLQRTHQWQLFDDIESDDELSFISGRSEGDVALQEITNTIDSGCKRQQPTKSAPEQKLVRPLDGSLLSDSEDELCI